MPLFMAIALLLIKKLPDFSFKKHTISKTVYFLKHPINMFIFRMNFIVKAILDLGFVYYLKFHFKISNPLAFLLILSVILFGSLSYFIMGKYTISHKIIIYSYIALWSIFQIYFAQLTENIFFLKLTYLLTAIELLLSFGFLFAKKTNVFVQAVCAFLSYSWLVIFVFRYL